MLSEDEEEDLFERDDVAGLLVDGNESEEPDMGGYNPTAVERAKTPQRAKSSKMIPKGGDKSGQKSHRSDRTTPQKVGGYSNKPKSPIEEKSVPLDEATRLKMQLEEAKTRTKEMER